MVNLDYLFDPSSRENIVENTFLQSKQLGFSTYSNAIIVPPNKCFKSFVGGVFKNGVLIKNTIDPCYSAESNYNETADLLLDDSAAIFVGYFVKCWGHFISDCLRYVWFLKRLKINNYKLVYIADENFELKGNYKRLLELLDIDISKLHRINRPTKFKNCIIPDPSFFYERSLNKYFFCNEYKETIEIIKNKFQKNSCCNNKIYYSYSSFIKNKKNGIKKQFNEEVLEKFFKKNGFLIIKPERLSLDEQLELLSNCSVFASTEGSSSHNSIFLRNNTTFLIIPRGPYTRGYQDALNHVNNLKTYYIDSTLSILTNEKSPWTGPFYYYVSDRLTSFFKINYYKYYWRCALKGFAKYFHYGLSLKRSSDYSCDNIYSKKLLSILSEKERQSFKKKIINKLYNHR